LPAPRRLVIAIKGRGALHRFNDELARLSASLSDGTPELKLSTKSSPEISEFARCVIGGGLTRGAGSRLTAAALTGYAHSCVSRA
jgi:hypothetical protein